MNLTLDTIKAVLVLDSTDASTRLLAKYYSPSLDKYRAHKDQVAFERGILAKTKKGSSVSAQPEIMLFDGQLIAYRAIGDITIAVVGVPDENELIIAAVLTAYVDAVSSLLRHQLEKHSFVENFDLMALALDECVDDGVVLEIDSAQIVARVSKRGYDSQEVAVAEQTLMQAYQVAKERLTQSLRS